MKIIWRIAIFFAAICVQDIFFNSITFYSLVAIFSNKSETIKTKGGRNYLWPLTPGECSCILGCLERFRCLNKKLNSKISCICWWWGDRQILLKLRCLGRRVYCHFLSPWWRWSKAAGYLDAITSHPRFRIFYPEYEILNNMITAIWLTLN